MDDELTPQETERVRRLLAEARHTEPVPDEVAARLDRTLADLSAEPTPVAPVVPLAERRRRAGRLLLAAAVVVVGGVAVGQVVRDGGDDNAATDAETASQADEGQDQLPAPDRDGDALSGNGAAEDGDAPGAVSDTRRSISRLPAQRVRPAHFAADAEAVRPRATGHRATREGAALSHNGDVAGLERCAPGPWGGGRYVRVAFGGESGWLVYRAPRGGTQVVDLFLCDTESPERSATLPLG